MEPNEQNEKVPRVITLGPAHVTSWPSQVKGNPNRKMTIQLEGDGDKLKIGLPSGAVMNFFMSSTGCYLATYNKDDQKGTVHDKKSKKDFPGAVKPRRAAMRKILYDRSKNRPRMFEVRETADGDLQLIRSWIAR